MLFFLWNIQEGTAKCVDPEVMNTLRGQGRKKSASEARKMSAGPEMVKFDFLFPSLCIFPEIAYSNEIGNLKRNAEIQAIHGCLVTWFPRSLVGLLNCSFYNSYLCTNTVEFMLMYKISFSSVLQYNSNCLSSLIPDLVESPL